MTDFRNRAWDTVMSQNVEWVTTDDPDPLFASYPESNPSDHAVIEVLSTNRNYRNRAWDTVLMRYVVWTTTTPDTVFASYPESNPSDHVVLEIIESVVPANAMTEDGVPLTEDGAFVVETP